MANYFLYNSNFIAYGINYVISFGLRSALVIYQVRSYLKSCKRLIFIILAYFDVLSIDVSVFLSPIMSGFSFNSDKIKSDKLKSDIMSDFLALKIEHFKSSGMLSSFD